MSASGPPMRRTIVFFHAHPDDEALLTGGTMARLSAEGHRVVLVTATAGELGLAAASVTATSALAQVRTDELTASARILGCARTVVLGYRDSGGTAAGHRGADPAGISAGAAPAFADLPVDVPARRLEQVLRQEAADVLTIYDAAGGYGHPDHVQVHRVGARAAELASTPVVLEATVDRSLLRRGLFLARWFTPSTPDFAPARFGTLFAARESITHRVDVRRQLRQKRAAMRSHSSQTTGDEGVERTLAWMLRLPLPLYRLAFGREWFIEHGRRPSTRPLDDVLATLGNRSPD